MEVSVVVPTLNARDQLAGCLDSLTEHAPDAERIVVNGPSSDGTTGMIQDRDDVDVLVELADRQVTVARNAGIDYATGDCIAFVDQAATVTPTWREAIEDGLSTADAVTGPTTAQANGEAEMREPESRTIAGREVTYFNPGNVAFMRAVLDEFDGFDEYLETGGSRDMAHRIAGQSYRVDWDDRMRLKREIGTDGGERTTNWSSKYRSLAYRLVKNYNLRPTVVRRLLAHAATDCYTELRAIGNGDTRPSEWLRTGKNVLTNIGGGLKAGLGARRRDRSARRNPSGRSTRGDRVVTIYDWR
ncbi:glycosyltransferase family 2 protein [Halovenus rubra]|uniref:Glycosyltransferase family 2 protein n=2 Tax=Halovenus rubra TaxID=869890 RepID=A0ACC7E321_9EURY|nr:glycosyltransferase [Halovenus rubra]